MITLLADVNVQGHIESMIKRMQAEPFLDFWIFLEMACVSFADVNIDSGDSDAKIWKRYQERKLFLLTNNRNDDGPESLECTIRTFNTPQSLPVFTIGDAERLRTDGEYANDVIWALLDYLVQEENILGTQRLYLP